MGEGWPLNKESISAAGWKKMGQLSFKGEINTARQEPAKLPTFISQSFSSSGCQSASTQTCYSRPLPPGAGPVCPEEAYQIVWRQPK